jgi:hypothetical protein
MSTSCAPLRGKLFIPSAQSVAKSGKRNLLYYILPGELHRGVDLTLINRFFDEASDDSAVILH